MVTRNYTESQQFEFPHLTNFTSIAKFARIDIKTVRKRAEGLPIVKESGNYKLYDALKLVHCVFTPTEDSEASKINLSQERAFYYKSLRTKVDLEIEQLKGDLVNAQSYSEEQEKYLIELRNNIMAMGRSLSHVLAKINDPEEIRQLICSEIEEVMESVASKAKQDEEDESKPQRKTKNVEPEDDIFSRLCAPREDISNSVF